MKIKKGVPMKKIINNKAMLVALVIISALALLSCGGGGGGDTPETNTTLTAGNAPQAAAGVLKAMDIADALQGLSGLMTTTSSSTTTVSAKSPISNIVNMTASALQNGQQQTQPSSMGNSMYSESIPCDEGTMVISDFTWDGLDLLNPPDKEDIDWNEVKNFKGYVTFKSCKKSTLTLNGEDVYISVTGSLTSPSAVTLSGSLDYTDTSNSTTISLDNANLVVSGISHVNSDFDMSNSTLVLTGGVQANVGGEDISFRGNGFTVKLKSITGGSEVQLSGKIRTACLETWLTITTSTTTPVKLMDGDACPTGGDVSASYEGNTVRAVIASGTNNISLYFNGTMLGGPTYTYENCTLLKGTCSP